METPVWNGKQNSLTGPVITGSFEEQAPGHFTLLFCRGRQRNVQRFITPARAQLLFCSLNLLFRAGSHFDISISISRHTQKMQIISTFYYGNFQQKRPTGFPKYCKCFYTKISLEGYKFISFIIQFSVTFF